MLEIKTNDADTAAKIIVVGVGGAGNNADEHSLRHCVRIVGNKMK